MKIKAIILDTETTGRKASTVIEAAHIELHDTWSRNIPAFASHVERFNPGIPIEMGAMATHHILDEELVNCRPSSEYVPPDAEYYIGHNIDFDWEVVGKPDVKRICTLALARWLWPKPVVDSHTQSALFYWMSTDRVRARERLRNAHSAEADVYICLDILRHIVHTLDRGDEAPTSWESLYQLSERARLPVNMPFGKHEDEPISSLPTSYVTWLLNRENLDPYLEKAVRIAHHRPYA